MIIHTQDQEYALGAVTQPRQPTSSGVPGQSGSLYSLSSTNILSRSALRLLQLQHPALRPEDIQVVGGDQGGPCPRPHVSGDGDDGDDDDGDNENDGRCPPSCVWGS